MLIATDCIAEDSHTSTPAAANFWMPLITGSPDFPSVITTRALLRLLDENNLFAVNCKARPVSVPPPGSRSALMAFFRSRGLGYLLKPNANRRRVEYITRPTRTYRLEMVKESVIWMMKFFTLWKFFAPTVLDPSTRKPKSSLALHTVRR